MKSILYILIASIILLNMSSCTQENDNEIEVELQVYFDNFIEEASLHGMEISLEDVDIVGMLRISNKEVHWGSANHILMGRKR